MVNIKQYIKTKLIEIHKNCTIDKYGQVSQFNFTLDIFGDREKEVEQYCFENKGFLKFATYGWRYGVYKSFTIEDVKLKKECNKALSSNKNYLKNLNNLNL